MSKTTVVNKFRERFDVYIGRPSIFGNPFVIGKDGSREDVILKYSNWFNKKIEEDKFREAVLMLKGMRLGCFCKPKLCHGDIIVAWLEKKHE